MTRDVETNQIGNATLSSLNHETGPVVVFTPPEPEPKEPSEITRALTIIGSALLELGFEIAKPHVKHFWQTTARPTITTKTTSARTRFTNIRHPARGRANPTDVADVLPAVQLPTMSSKEAQQRLAAAFIAKMFSDKARAFSDEQLSVLLNARIEDADSFLALRTSWENLTPEQVETHMAVMLEANPSFVEDFTRLLWHNQTSAAPQMRAAEGKLQ